MTDRLLNWFLSNWKTNSAGIVGLAVVLANIWAPPAWQSRINATGFAITSSGLLAAKDNKK